MDPADKVALITGGARGIGLAICKELLQNKVKVIFFSCLGIKFMFPFLSLVYLIVFLIEYFKLTYSET
jgi:hypothetical protein